MTRLDFVFVFIDFDHINGNEFASVIFFVNILSILSKIL